MVAHSSREGDIVGLDASNGDQLWKYTEADGDAGGILLVDGVAYVDIGRNTFYAIDTETGNPVWTFEWSPRTNIGGGTDVTPAVTGDTMYFRTQNGVLYALDRANGDKRWEYRTEPQGEDTYSEVHGDPVVADDTVYFGGGYNNLHALDAGTGVGATRFPTGWMRRSGRIRPSRTATYSSALGTENCTPSSERIRNGAICPYIGPSRESGA